MDIPDRSVYMKLRTQNEWRTHLKQLIKGNDKALLHSILAIYERQTPEERTSRQSVVDNKVGFTKWDAEEMSDIARKIKEGIPLSSNEMIHARIVMPKYWRQLMEISKVTVARWQEEEYNRRRTQECDLVKEFNKAMLRCVEEGVPCEYGICSECIVGQGMQVHL